MKAFLPWIAAFLLLFAYAAAWSGEYPRSSNRVFRDGCGPTILARAEQRATPTAAKILALARIMTVNEHTIVRGACWDYMDAVWNRAGYPAERRRTVFKSKMKGPYAAADSLEPGDWLYFINHSYGDIEHSALFVGWADRSRLQAYMLSYAGEQRAETARYKRYDLTGVYRIIRAKG
jgi:hypothetical protein